MSKRIAAGTIGTVTGPARYPISRSAKNRTTPDAESSPNALPPLKTTAWTSETWLVGLSKVGLASARSRAANVDAPDRTTPAQHDGASAAALTVSCVADLNACHVGYRTASVHKKTSPIRVGEANVMLMASVTNGCRHTSLLCNWCSPFRNGLAARRIIAGARTLGEGVLG